MKQSEHIEAFLDWVRECGAEYNIAMTNEQAAAEETQDLLHKLEIDETTYHEKAKIGQALTAVRRERREAKDTVAILDPVVDWKKKNKTFLDSLEGLLGRVRKAEKDIEGRTYRPRTDIVERTIGPQP